MRGSNRRRGLVVPALVVATGALLLLPAAAGAASFTWSGAELLSPSSAHWSNGANWEGTAPSGTVETLTFPALTSSACTAKPPTATCYFGENDISGLKVKAIKIDDGVGYNITGSNAITLGAGGITASPSAIDPFHTAELHVPITLSAPQKWTITGDELGVNANVSGPVSDPLGIVFGSPAANAFTPNLSSLAAVQGGA